MKRSLRCRRLVLERLESRCLLTVFAGNEFQVNVTTDESQFLADVAADASGDFVVVWDSIGQDGEGHGVVARRFRANGTPIGGELPVNSTTAGDQLLPRVASDSDGNFIVVWEGQTASEADIFGQSFDAAGNTVGDEFVVNTTLDDLQLEPAVARNSTGDTVVVWYSWFQDADLSGVFGQRFDGLGNPVGEEFQVNQTETDLQVFADVAVADDGAFVVVWESVNQDGDGSGIYARQFDADGNGGDEFLVNTETAGEQSLPAVSMNSGGQFVIVWDSEVAEGWLAHAQRFNSDGTPLGDSIVVSQQVTTSNALPRVTVDDRFHFSVVWGQPGAETDDHDVLRRDFDQDGLPKADAYVVNSTVANHQTSPAIAGWGSGASVVVWDSLNQDGSGMGVFGQQFRESACSWTNPLIAADVDGNGSVEAVDLLVLITEINGKDVADQDGRLPPLSPPDVGPPPFFDVAECNGYVTPSDLLVVITFLNEQAGGEGEANNAGRPDGYSFPDRLAEATQPSIEVDAARPLLVGEVGTQFADLGPRSARAVNREAALGARPLRESGVGAKAAPSTARASRELEPTLRHDQFFAEFALAAADLDGIA